MAKKDRKKSSMASRVKRDAKNSGNKGGALRLPEGFAFFQTDTDRRQSIDIIPYEISDKNHPDVSTAQLEVGELWYKRPYKVHRSVGAENQAVICPRSVKKPCPICEHRSELMKDPDADEEVTKQLKPQEKVLYNLIPRSGKQKDEKCVFDMSFHNFQRQLDAELNDPDNEEFLGFADVEGGATVRVRFSEEKFGKNKFARAERIDFEERDALTEEELEGAADLDKLLQIKSYEQIQALFFEMEDTAAEPEEKDEPKEEEEKPSRRRKSADKPKKKKEPEPEPEEDDEIEDDDEEDDEPEPPKEKPKKKSEKVKPKKKKDADEDECPHGHNWGEADDHKECDDCDKWDDCIAAA